ncbi:radical SAM protein [Campylobacter coli]|uniref:Radical SAM protein n=3 Tax=Campylobacter coli TaxID=195 RepID=A0A0Q2W6F7_CAMCO|nr:MULTISPECIES: radical SAM protein [Campylobacter]EAI5699031.1 radical SAM protein [Campylobacter jejuni]EAI7421890.1 radical SAM protein [Campylobacter hyointestinalis]EAL3816349.1 radical SAM protein [Campylobacter fetus]EIA55894.1 radical SAM domain-containing protein [Campylobacter coli 2692]EIA56694.1 radical SAM domain-containing protein [Campylobacter coli 2698]EIA87826.1 radical SAM domain-containing protein [Campylobacter coli 67-8]EIB05877.1 radical SAM domain-containing protein 
MKILFGPINSRRFGRSLGIDLSPSKKQCNFDCVYCELEAQKPQEKQDEIVSVEEIILEVQGALEKNVPFDFLTLTANGEPSLYPHLDELISSLRKIAKDKKLLILSNGTVVLDQDKFNTLLKLDVVKFSLDSAISKTFYRIDRALKNINLEKMIEKMAEFKTQFKGDLVMEILVVKDLNDNEEEFIALNQALAKIAPLRVDLSTIDRPPAYAVKKISEERLLELSKLITSTPVLLPKRHYEGEKLNFNEEELLKMLHLRSQSEIDIENKLDKTSQLLLDKLIKEEKIKILNLAGVKFYKA